MDLRQKLEKFLQGSPLDINTCIESSKGYLNLGVEKYWFEFDRKTIKFHLFQTEESSTKLDEINLNELLDVKLSISSNTLELVFPNKVQSLSADSEEIIMKWAFVLLSILDKGKESSSSKDVHLNLTRLSYPKFKELLFLPDQASRIAKVESLASSSLLPSSEVLERVPMSVLEEGSALFTLLFGGPGVVFAVPFLLVLVGVVWGKKVALLLALITLLPLGLMPLSFRHDVLTSWSMYQLLRYFSFKISFSHYIQKDRPTILVAPPHGVFPFGNILTMIAFPSVMGYSFRGLAASAALHTPCLRQFLVTIGVIDASRSSAMRALGKGMTIGISTGGVREVFETNSPDGNEHIVFNKRKPLVRLAFRSGADLVPCYLFGNTRLYSMWTGGSEAAHNQLGSLSRKIGFALILFWGRLFLPVPYRKPILGVMGEPIPVPKKEHPSEEEVEEMHSRLVQAMQELFEKHKHSYGWGDKKLVIKDV